MKSICLALTVAAASVASAQTNLEWSLGTANPHIVAPSGIGIQMHGTGLVEVGAKKFLYVVGGNAPTGDLDTSFDSRNIYYSEITGVGTMSATWTTTTLVLPMAPPPGSAVLANYAYINNAVDSYNGRLYVAGGNTQGANPERNEIAIMTPTATGDITAKTTITPNGFTFNQIFKAMTIDKVNGRMYVISAEALRSGNVYVADINPTTGDVGAFTLAGTFPVGLRQMPCVVVAGRLYSLGGNAATPASVNNVQVGDIGANGILSNLRQVSALPIAVNDATAVAIDNVIYVIGGTTANSNATCIPTIQKGTVDVGTGNVTWTTDTPLPASFVTTGLRRASAATDGAAIYVPGGRDNLNILNKTAIGVPTPIPAAVQDWTIYE